MTSCTSSQDYQRDGVGVLLAALRDDRETLALFMQDMPREDVVQVALFCAYYAAATCQELQELRLRGDSHAALQHVAAQLAARDTRH